ncbi:MAG: succinyl-diaminopimelate desuccinylase [Methylococcales bacterium]|nr:succinyl-diaminopimelate desuccinylase [Methylococcales bacterium]
MSDTLTLTEELIRKASVTPDDAGCMELISNRLAPLGFTADYLDFGDTKNLWLRRGDHQPLFVFLGHTDVVPPGPEAAWLTPPFTPTIRDNQLYGRGAADMKGAVASFIVAVERFLTSQPRFPGSIAMLLTSDEEGIATNGIVKAIDVLHKRGDNITWCLVGEPSSHLKLGDVIRVGRRGSLNGQLTIKGKQGHVAYPELALNPIHAFAPALTDLVNRNWDQGNDFFPPTRLQISNIAAGTGAENVIPGELSVTFNLRFSPESTSTGLQQQIHALLDKHGLNYDLSWRLSGEPFLTRQGRLLAAAHQAITEVTGLTARNDTGGGTSDGRFIAPTGAEVIELGLLNHSIHQVNEHTPLADLEQLAVIYQGILQRLYGNLTAPCA